MAYILKNPEVFRVDKTSFKKDEFPGKDNLWFIAQLQNILPSIPIRGDATTGWSCICYSGFNEELVEKFSKYVNFIEGIRC